MKAKKPSIGRVMACAILMLSGVIRPAAAAGQDSVTADQLTRVDRADIVLLGEVHDNPNHHLFQAQFIDHLAPKAVVFEMLTATQATAVTPQALADPATLGAPLDWAASGWPPFEIYQPIFAALGRAAVVGAALERRTVKRVFGARAADVFGQGHMAYGLHQPLPAAQQLERTLMQYDAHCQAMPMEMMGAMVEAQRLRDAAFADAVLTALDTYGAPVVLIAGNGHTRKDWGVPHMLRMARNDLSVLSVGMLEQPQPEAPYDMVIVNRHPRANDPCDAFKS